MAEDLKKIKIKDLPNSETIDDSDLFPNTDTLETRNVTADVIAEYVSQNKHVTDTYINQNKIGVANGVAPLNGNKKINGDYITYGTTANTAYQGSAGKTLETNLDNHILDSSNPHKVTKAQVGLGNVDNTSDMDKPVSTAQQTALDKKVDETTVASSSTLGLVKSGTDITVDSNGNVSVNDDSHNHVISNIDGLQSMLDGKVPTTRTVNGKALSANITLSASDVGADASGSANTTVSNHNVSTTSHNDIRNLITDLTTRLNTLADSDDTTLDQMSELVAYIKDNRELIESVTTNKVSVSDIVDNLTTASTDKVLSAKQGTVIKSLIDALELELNNHASNTTAHITSTERTNWNDANNKKHTHSNKTVLDGITSALITSWNNAVTHISDTVKHITSDERTLWNTVSNKVDKVSGKGLSTNDYTTTDKTKLDGIATGAEVNQNAFSNVVVGSTTIAADAKTDSLTLVGSNVTLTPDATNDKVTIGITKENIESALGYTPGTGNSNTDTNTTYSLSKSGSTITLTGSDGSTTSVTDSDTNTVYTHQSYTARTGKPTANQTPAFGGTATVSQITSDATGHITDATDRTITIPSTLSNGTGTAGLIKTTSTVTSNSGYTACPVISGVPYYKDTNTQTITGIKGNAETSYRTGNVNITPANIGALASDGTAQKAVADENGNTLTVEQISTTEPTNQKVGDSWLLEY